MREPIAAGRWPACLLAAALAGCAASPTRSAPEPALLASPAPAPSLPAASSAPPATPAPAGTAAPAPLLAALGYAERVRSLPAPELGQEIQRLGERSYAPLEATQLALALGQSRTAANQSRAQSLLQRVIADPAAEAQGACSPSRACSPPRSPTSAAPTNRPSARRSSCAKPSAASTS